MIYTIRDLVGDASCASGPDSQGTGRAFVEDVGPLQRHVR